MAGTDQAAASPVPVDAPDGAPSGTARGSTILSGVLLALFRVAVGVLFLQHGLATVFGLLGGAHGGDGGAAPLGAWPGWWAGIIQLVAGVLVILGLGTRPAALLASGSMAYAYFVVHQPNGLLPLNNGGENAALFAWAFLVLAATGAGAWSLDHRIRRRRAT